MAEIFSQARPARTRAEKIRNGKIALAGNTADVDTHLETWEVLRALAGRPDFLHVADCKLCSRENLQAIDHRQGRFITILPRNRREDGYFRDWPQPHAPAWQDIASRRNPRQPDAPPQSGIGRFASPIPSAEGFCLVWIHRSLKQERELRQTMKTHRINSLPLYPEDRDCRALSAEATISR